MTRRTKVAGSDLGPDWNGQRCAAKAIRWSKVRSSGRECRSWFQNGACSGRRLCDDRYDGKGFLQAGPGCNAVVMAQDADLRFRGEQARG